MRVVLAIAERYQPRSVKPRSGSDPKQLPPHNAPRDHMSRGGYPANRVHSPDQIQHPRPSFQAPLAANSFSVPNMSAISRTRSLSQPVDYMSGYGPPQQSYVGLSQPERTYGSYQEQSHMGYSFSQGDGENDTYSIPVDQLPPSAAPHIVAPRKTLGECVHVVGANKCYWYLLPFQEYSCAFVLVTCRSRVSLRNQRRGIRWRRWQRKWERSFLA